ncbi:ribosome small subunit-dependent GTPase A [Flavobacteriaceae bacterium S0825]|uniref:ribosome small subunit-dependent GTPase A n=1 Tax=Gaetbulibacter sp. S0825 TaxID=2720084 RepID=UPI0014308FE0|nr:ribosome small subunit-dependent GTPase A [Gaetbulibacter sp. S0825]MCK0109526.1 ribosome small subunit-dependent GTPase A [Flavobacteriaceae bacterium S0825]NIX65160.1 ribosome small subunit-dependent GTPase A [Gaetbulibacter sp. S0825]
MTLKDLGYNDSLESFRIENGLDAFEVGRVILEHKERYVVKTPKAEFDAELIGNLRFTAESRYDFPAVGDWVAFTEYDEGKGLIHKVFPRYSILERQAVGKSGQVQIIATNIDYGLIVQAVDRDFNLNRLERYLIICNASKVVPVIVLSKTDLISNDDLETILIQINNRIKDVKTITVSNLPNGYDALETFIDKGNTYCLLGSSGVGKSTLLNGLSGNELMKTAEISTSVNKGKHTTSHRELIVLNNGGVLIDNPGMREVGIADTTSGLEVTFDTILEFAEQCKFKDCTHEHENGCAVQEAIENGDINTEAFANFRKMEREKEHFESDALERKKKDKDLGKLIKNVQKQRRNTKY